MRDKLGRFVKGIHPATEFKKGLVPWIKGKHHSEKTKEELSEKFKGRHHSSTTEFKKGLIPWNKGKHWSEEVKTKLKKSHKGMLGKHHSEKTRIKIGLANSITLKGKYLGENSPRWKNGRRKSLDGYVRIYQPNHPFCDKNKTVLEHRLVIEKILGHYLKPSEECHHLNEIRDNNRPENLMAFINKSIHQHFHKDPNSIKPSEIIFDGRILL